ncbi:MmgE/PrpD family protein [Halarchaeum nitratireducens]|uniref:2-methylcitrate dehydratase n=1 Tax=Halarchaeum nitratireducens TaxID=489913 RepID=A0A830GA73_9EURY|nr:MmgE/PrpD family protein [Halarchaeum nitratireducens]GGN11818.1 2-methylcitrate dehydratase [Halarchaeum nitratireducens]
MTTAADIAAFVADVTYDDLSAAVADATERRLFDALAVAHVASDAAGAAADVAAGEGGDACACWAASTRAGPAAAALHNAARVRGSAAADAFLAPDGPSHPSEAVPAVVAAAEAADADGETLVAALAATYEVHGELAWHAPVREHGWGPAIHTLVAAAAGAARARSLDAAATRDAVSIAVANGASFGAGPDDTDHDLAGPLAARAGVTAASLAAAGVAGPADPFVDHPVLGVLADGAGDADGAAADDGVDEAREGAACEFGEDTDSIEAHAEEDGFALDPACERVHDVAARRVRGPFAVQAAVAAAADLGARVALDPDAVERVTVRTFDSLTLPAPANDPTPDTVTDAARSLPYSVAAALVSGPTDLADILGDEAVRRLAATVAVEEAPGLTAQFEAGLLPAVVDVERDDGSVYHAEVGAYPGHPTQPMDWATLEAKAGRLLPPERVEALRAACQHADEATRVADVLAALEASAERDL